MELIATKSTFSPAEPITVDAAGAGRVELWHLDQLIASAVVDTDGRATFPPQAIGGYGLVARDGDGGWLRPSAIDVLSSPFDRPRYGFVADFPAHHAPDELVATARRLHLNLIQFYDWAHRYAQLVPDTDDYLDPLNRELSLPTVAAMATALHELNTLALGYAAVYAVGGVDWDRWQPAGLFKADGEPHRFPDDLLLVIDPANEEWMKHFTADLDQSMKQVGFDGFHLDSYGWPKRAFRADGSVCDLNDAFSQLLTRIHHDVPASQHMFNNVNDFPTWSTTRAPQAATYIEVWAPHSTLAHLGTLLERTRAFRADVPPILAAYLSVYRDAPLEQADATARLVMATIFSHGGTHLLNGEGDRVLVDPYYPRNHEASASTRALMGDWYDFLVRYGYLLLAPEAVDVTRSYTGGINEDIIAVAPDGVRVSTDAEPGSVWIRVVRTRRGLMLHLINLTDQSEIGWDVAKQPIASVTGVRLRVLKTLATLAPLAANPDAPDPALTELPVESDGQYDVITLPPLTAWTVIALPDPDGWHAR
jgi:dextranase